MLGFGEGGEEVGFGFGGAVGPGFVAFEVGVEAAFCVLGGNGLAVKGLGVLGKVAMGCGLGGWDGKGKLLTLHGRMR